MNLSNFQEVFQIVENKTDFDNNYTSQNTHGSYITNDQELLTPSFINDLNTLTQPYEMFDEQQQFQIAQIWKGKSNSQSQIIKDEYFQFTPTQSQWEKYFRLYIQSLKSLADMKTEHTKYSLFHQQLSYSIPKNNCYLTIDTDVYIPKSALNDTTNDRSQMFKEDDDLLIQFMETLRTILAKYIRIPMVDQYYELDSSHKLFDYIITCRAKTDNVDNPDHKSKNENYVRYGYHTYFYNLVCSQETKIMLYNLIINELQQDKSEFSILNKLKERYQETFQLSEYLDRGPFVATSSLPFTSGSPSSVYIYMIDPEDNVRITATSRAQRFKELFLNLNPFRGFGIPIKTKFQVNQNIITFTKTDLNHCYNYFTGIRLINSHIMNNIIHKDTIKWFYHNIVLKVQHLYWNDHKDVFIQNAYTLLNQDLFLTELFYFIAMCEDPEGIIKSEDERYQTGDAVDNFQLNRERDRYPIKCHLEVQRVLKDRLNGTNQSKIVQEDEEEKAIRTLIEWYNNIMEQRRNNFANDERPCAPIIYENPYSIYQKFSNFLQRAWNSCLASTPFENLNIDYIKSQFDIYLYQTVFKNTRCISEQGKNIQTHDDTLYEYIPIEEETKKNIHPYEPTPEQGHYQILKTSKFISIMSNSYDKLINDYALIVNSSARFNELQTEDDADSQQSEKPNSKISKQKKIIQSLTIYKVRLSENSCKQLIPALSKAHGFDQIAQPNNTRMILGVYNGILKYDSEKKNFYMLGNDECIKYFQTQTTLFKVPKQFINKDGFLISEQNFQESTLQELEPYKKAYQKILQIFTDIFGESQLCVLKWKISSILFQILAKTPTQHILIEYGTGGDGKSMNNEAIQYILGLSSNNQQVLYEEESRKIQNIGYSTIAKSSVLITSEVSSAQHDSGGLSELEQSYFASFAELTSNQPLSSSAIKRLVGGTSITCRKAHSPNSTSFVNKAFIVLQTNNYPRFDQTLDDGTVRRMLFYQYPHKFLDLADYNKAKDKTNIRLKDFSLQNIFQENIYMVDMFGVFMLWTFLESQQNVKITSHNPIARPTIPQIVVQQSQQFFQTYDKECNTFLQKYLYIQNLQNTTLNPQSLNTTTIESQESSTVDPQPQLPQLIHCMTYTSLRTLIDMYCNENQVKFNKTMLMDNITYYINKTFMSRICVYQTVEKRGKMIYKRIPFDINAFETYIRQQTYIIFYDGFQPKRGNQVGQELTEDDRLRIIIEDQIDGKKKQK